jgi:hypothetical protein
VSGGKGRKDQLFVQFQFLRGRLDAFPEPLSCGADERIGLLADLCDV